MLYWCLTTMIPLLFVGSNATNSEIVKRQENILMDMLYNIWYIVMMTTAWLLMWSVLIAVSIFSVLLTILCIMLMAVLGCRDCFLEFYKIFLSRFIKL